MQGTLIGGCIEVLEFAKGTSLWPNKSYWKDSILFFETSEDTTRTCALSNIGYETMVRKEYLQNVKGIIFGKPQNEKYYEEYKESIWRIMKELDLTNLPILYNLNFGHTEPKFVLPYGAMAEINCENETIFYFRKWSGVKNDFLYRYRWGDFRCLHCVSSCKTIM